MNHWMTGWAVALLALNMMPVMVAQAEEPVADPPAAAKPAADQPVRERIREGRGRMEMALTNLTVTGTLLKEERTGRDGKPRSFYVVTNDAGTAVQLFTGRRRRGAAAEAPAPVNLDTYVNQKVTVVGKGFERERDGKKTTMLVEITKIEVIPPAPDAK